jgi:hypothetical protein
MLPDDPVLRGRLFRAARCLLGWSQAGLARAAGVGTAVVHRVEAGRPGARHAGGVHLRHAPLRDGPRRPCVAARRAQAQG